MQYDCQVHRMTNSLKKGAVTVRSIWFLPFPPPQFFVSTVILYRTELTILYTAKEKNASTVKEAAKLQAKPGGDASNCPVDHHILEIAIYSSTLVETKIY